MLGARGCPWECAHAEGAGAEGVFFFFLQEERAAEVLRSAAGCWLAPEQWVRDAEPPDAGLRAGCLQLPCWLCGMLGLMAQPFSSPLPGADRPLLTESAPRRPLHLQARELCLGGEGGGQISKALQDILSSQQRQQEQNQPCPGPGPEDDGVPAGQAPGAVGQRWGGTAAGHQLHFGAGAVPAQVAVGSHCCLGSGRRGAGVCGSGWGGWERFVLGSGGQKGERGLAGLFGGE